MGSESEFPPSQPLATLPVSCHTLLLVHPRQLQQTSSWSHQTSLTPKHVTARSSTYRECRTAACLCTVKLAKRCHQHLKRRHIVQHEPNPLPRHSRLAVTSRSALCRNMHTSGTVRPRSFRFSTSRAFLLLLSSTSAGVMIRTSILQWTFPAVLQRSRSHLRSPFCKHHRGHERHSCEQAACIFSPDTLPLTTCNGSEP